jgi:hypothetical protein
VTTFRAGELVDITIRNARVVSDDGFNLDASYFVGCEQDFVGRVRVPSDGAGITVQLVSPPAEAGARDVGVDLVAVRRRISDLDLVGLREFAVTLAEDLVRARRWLREEREAAAAEPTADDGPDLSAVLAERLRGEA